MKNNYISEQFYYLINGLKINTSSLYDLIKERGHILCHHHKIPFFVIQLVEDGYVNQTVDYKEIISKNEELVFLHPEQINKYNQVEGNVQILIFTEDFLVTSLKQKTFFSLSKLFNAKIAGKPIHVSENFKELKTIFLLISSVIKNDITNKETILNSLLFSILLLIEEIVNENNEEIIMSRESLLVSNFKELVNKEVNKKQSVEYFSEKLNVSVRTLQKAFAKADQTTAREYIDNRIIFEAKLLLIKNEMNIGEISYILGFKDLSHFSKFFKLKTGTSPKFYRKRVA
ncbi:transcriptional regulator [Empedobacter brevis NBRC 14943 = ATCC 43319]|uniref:Transcriptional regulator n=1 Tax=Empedobacter brevis NBRC 14943 = ATCC 43319 TaxID=1218108 RepID=A0A511NCQ3_9FLAO|nr:helix-turn-helix domain-containing protein [Empedobacter brevis]GEM50594.1 transcriptional regulator [Empedobacter brevis NBRC 14943 = ATCC 43319]